MGVSTQARNPLWEPDQPIRSVWFPIKSVNSIIAMDDNGGQVEVGTVGNEGVVGLPLFLGARSAPGRALQDRGLLKYSRGTLEICDRPGLIETACSCYRIVRDQFDKLLGP